MADGVLIDRDFARKLAEMFRWYQGQKLLAAVPVDQRMRPDPISVYNQSANTIPPFGCMKVTDAKYEAERKIILVDEPNDDGGPFLFNGGREIETEKFGYAQTGPIIIGAIDSGTPEVGETWGPTTGFKCTYLGQPAALVYGKLNDNFFIGNTSHRQLLRLGKPDSNVTAGGTGTISIWSGSGTATDTTENSTAELDWMEGGDDISSGKEVLIQWVIDEGQWRITGAECE